REAQFARAELSLEPWRATLAEARLGDCSWAIATPRPAQWLALLRDAGVPAEALDASGIPSSGTPSSGEATTVRVGDADAWLLDHLALTQLRRSGRLVVHGCTRSELRTLVRSRGP